MSDLSELYQQVILDHNRNPRNFKRLESANRPRPRATIRCAATASKCSCSSTANTIRDVGFQMPQGSGCARSRRPRRR